VNEVRGPLNKKEIKTLDKLYALFVGRSTRKILKYLKMRKQLNTF